MGRNERPWRADPKAQATKKWDYWPGTWRSPKSSRPQGPTAEHSQPSFPAYDAVPLNPHGLVAVQERRLNVDGQVANPSIVQLAQTAVNHTRRLDAKHARLQKELREKHLHWERYVATLKESLKTERTRYQQSVKRIEAEIAEVSEQQTLAHQQLEGIMPGGTKGMEIEETGDLDEIFASEGPPAASGLAALQEMTKMMAMMKQAGITPEALAKLTGPAQEPVPVTPPHRLRQGSPMTPPTTSTGVPAMVDPYIASPSAATLSGSVTAGASPSFGGAPDSACKEAAQPPSSARITTPPHTSQRPLQKSRRPTSEEVPRKPIKEAAKEATSASPKGKSIEEKLEQKRQKLKASLETSETKAPAEDARTEAARTEAAIHGSKHISLLDDDTEDEDLSILGGEEELRTME